MIPRIVEVAAPSRLHFGMLSFGQPGLRQFGGVGAMLSAPGVRLTISPAERLQVDGPASSRVEHLARRIATGAAWARQELRCRIHVECAPPEHVGLGSGTSLGMALAMGLNAFFRGDRNRAEQFARAAGRGRRSAIGVHGAIHGGLLVEAGKLSADELSPLVGRVELPSHWRWVLLTPAGEQGLSGQAEEQAFRDLPEVAIATTGELCRLVLLELMPSAMRGDFADFSDSLYRFGRLAGECFSTQQAGAYATTAVGRLVARIRSLGVIGTGQTSWGPTAFALLDGPASADRFCALLRQHEEGVSVRIAVAEPDNRGTKVDVREG